MRIFVIAIVSALVGTFAITAEADAGYKKGKRYSSGEWSYDDGRRVKANRQQRYSQDTEADLDRANNCDPAGRFGGYPAWARIAFSCGNRR